MRFTLAQLPLLALAALTATAKQSHLAHPPTPPPPSSAQFNPHGLSAYHPVDISSSQELAGTSLKATHTYTLYLDIGEANGGRHDSWVGGVKGQQGWLEAKQAVGGKRVVQELTKVGEVE